MNKVMKAAAALMLMVAVFLAVGCTKDNSGSVATAIPLVETSQVHDITETKAIGSGVVTSDGGGSIIERGVCWSKNQTPIVSGNHAIAGTGAGTFSCEIFDLEPNTTYYVRAYAINSMGVGYGNQVSFTTLSGSGGGVNAPEGAVKGIYSVSAMEKVYFSMGNLQYQASTGTWRFAEKQYYTVGEDGNQNISPTYDGWIDRFAWGTSGWNSGANCYQPWSISTTNSDYYPGGSDTNNLTGSYSNADWGVYNSISNGGNQAGMWRTLTRQEWVFLLMTRYTSSGIRYAKALVNGVKGVIIVPDDWNATTFSLNNTNEFGDFASNVVSEMVWQNTFEPAGAVFLPYQRYWSATHVNQYSAFIVDLYYSYIADGAHAERGDRLFVRLVCPVE